MAENAERGVIFTLKAQVDAQAKSAVDSFFASLTEASNNVSSATEKVVKTAERSAEEIVKSWTSAFDAVNTSASQVKQDDSAIQAFLAKSGEAYEAFTKSQADRLQRLTDAESQNREVSAMSLAELLDEQNSRTESAYERDKRTVDEALAKELQAMNAYFAAVEALRNKAANQAEELTNEEIEDVQRLEKEAVDATQNRQKAVKEISMACDVMLVVGSANSSNTVRLVDVALEAGARAAYRVDFAKEIDEAWLVGAQTVGLTSGASVPEILVNGVLTWLAERGYTDVEEVETIEEHLIFALPPELRRDIKASGRA